MRSIRTRFLCTVLAGTVVTASPVLAELSSRYTVAGRDAAGHTSAGQNYAIVAAFAASGQVYHVNFTVGANGVASGVAVEYENSLGLAARGSDGKGYLALYQRTDAGWTGIITAYSRNDLGSEVLYNGRAPGFLDPKQTPSVQVTGTYAMAGTNPDGTTYSGKVRIVSGDGIVDIFRDTGTEETVGTVIAANDTLAINVSARNQAADRREIGIVGVFIPQTDGFLGVWKKPGSDRLGAERWVRE